MIHPFGSAARASLSGDVASGLVSALYWASAPFVSARAAARFGRAFDGELRAYLDEVLGEMHDPATDVSTLALAQRGSVLARESAHLWSKWQRWRGRPDDDVEGERLRAAMMESPLVSAAVFTFAMWRIMRMDPRARAFEGSEARWSFPQSYLETSAHVVGYLDPFMPAVWEYMSGATTLGERTFDAAYRRVGELMPAARAIVDLGAGTGVLARRLRAERPEARLTAVELSPFMLAWGRRRLPEATWVRADVCATGLPRGGFDGASLTFVLHELSPAEIRGSLEEAARLLAPGGRLVIAESLLGLTPRARRLAARFFGPLADEPHLRTYAEVDLPGLLAEVGFVDIRSEHRPAVAGVGILSATRAGTITGTIKG